MSLYRTLSYSKYPLGQLVEVLPDCIRVYVPEEDVWKDGLFRKPDPAWKRLTEADADFFRYELMTAEMLTHHYGASYLEGRNFRFVRAQEDTLFNCYYRQGESPEDAAIDMGYGCG